jgi:hypothetical protein
MLSVIQQEISMLIMALIAGVAIIVYKLNKIEDAIRTKKDT